ncbi:ubiquitin-protein ligase E3A-like isoform X2 [Babylonia areolata]|uniref:ubiquitin-protein ligase E3A-like isoform X2 n=1 Tax=Babylonia areolata TaxID=304850 RepID=UPI003FD17DA7
MNPSNQSGGQEPASDSAVTGSGADQDEMKRQAARQRIQNYYKQLTDGCGNSDCDNPSCASCPDFTFKSADRNTLAAQALRLLQERARLCDGIPEKYTKFPVQETDEISYLDEEKMISLIKEGQSSGSWNRLIRTIGSVFSNPDSLMRSFCVTTVHSKMEPDPDKDVDDTETETMHIDHLPVQESGEEVGASSKSPNDLSKGDVNTAEDSQCTVDIESLHRAYSQLLSLPDLPFQRALINALKSLSNVLRLDFKYHHIVEKNPNIINIFVIIMEFPQLHSPEYLEEAFPAFCKTLGLMPLQAQARLVRVWASFGTKRLTEMLHMLQQLVTVRIINNEGRWGRAFNLNDDEAISGSCSVMKIVYFASLYGGVRDSAELLAEEKLSNEADVQNMAMEGGAMGMEPKEQSQPKEDPLAQELKLSPIDVRKPLIPPEEFVNEPLNEHIEISTDYEYYRAKPESKFSFMLHSFVLTTASKHMQMYFDNRIRMLHERRTSLLHTLMHGGPPMPYLRLRVRRDHVVDDALVNLEMMALENPADLKKQLFVEFDGEQGLDEGGVSKEFFQLIVEELFNPDIGMFTFNEETRQFWFNPLSFETVSQFTLIGIVLGLAIYNSCILDVRLPMVVYRKLLGKKGVFQDLFDVDPTLAKSLQQLLDHEGDDVEEVYMQTFRIGFKDIFGNDVQENLKDNGADILVTQSNKQEFVDLYADFILNKSIETQFCAFKKGFLMVTSESPLKYLFRPEEVETLVCGSKEYDFCALEQSTEYDGGFTATSQTIKNFWEVVHEFSEEDKKRLLQFTTGCDRVPVGGLSKLKFIIARNGSDSEKLPTSHTCFNVLLLPDYSTKEKLKERLVKAIMYAKGFGML